MKMEAKVLSYTKDHPQPVRIVWVNRTSTIYDALEAVTLCSDRAIAGRIVAAEAEDSKLEHLLNGLVDRD